MIPQLSPKDAERMTEEMTKVLASEGWDEQDINVGLVWVSTLLTMFHINGFPVENLRFTRILRLVADAIDRVAFGESPTKN